MDGGMRPEKIRLGLIKKKQCDARALKIVEKLLDPTTKEWFRDAALFLNTSYYDDVVDERSCIQRCGYPQCDRYVASTFQKYHISMRQNKVFDITERKKFCCNVCFKSSEFYRGQLLTSPLWLRDEADQQKQVKFLDEIDLKDKESALRTGEGDEIYFFDTKAIPNKNGQKEQGSSLSPKTGRGVDILSAEVPTLSISNKKPKGDNKPLSYKAAKTGLQKVESAISSWYTIDTFRVIAGDRFVRTVLKEIKCSVDKVMSAVGDENMSNVEFQSRYIELCRKLDLKELGINDLDDASDSRTNADGCEAKGGTCRMLKEEALVERLEVTSFFQGKTDYERRVSSANTKSNELRVTENETTFEPRIPLVDTFAQVPLRKRIVSEQLDSVMPDVLQLLGMLRSDISRSLARFIDSFSLDAESIVLKPEDWTLVAIFIVKMISFQDAVCKKRLQQPEARKNLSLVLLSYGIDEKQLNTKIEGLHSNIHHLIRKMKQPST